MHYKSMHPTDAEDIQIVINYSVSEMQESCTCLSSKLVPGSNRWSTEVLITQATRNQISISPMEEYTKFDTLIA